jgi:hypothetical protein
VKQQQSKRGKISVSSETLYYDREKKDKKLKQVNKKHVIQSLSRNIKHVR